MTTRKERESMIRDITIGQYYPSESFIHRLDPRVKLFATFVYIISLFLSKNLIGFAVAGVFLIGFIMISRVPFHYMIKGLKPVWILLLFICIVNVCFGKGEVLYFEWNFIHVYREGIMQATIRVIRLVELILGSSLMTYTTTPTALTDGLEKAFHPLTKLHVPVHEIALMMSITLRFIPILIEELDLIMKAQTARGVDFDEGNIIKKLKRNGRIFMPLFASAVGRASDLALAMEARCYEAGRPRTKMHPLQYARVDGCAYVFTVVYLAGMIGLMINC